ncbi:MAG: DUF2085 domain-containing protein, partial [Candidatus Atribacteria bacterium]|nr:DUF2085 domain-containing protein [Candidatus Atribacteria bacterium]
YTRAGCELCKQAEEDLNALQEVIPHQLAILDIDSDPSLRDTFALEIPVVEAGPFRLKAPFTRQDLKMTLAAAADRRFQLENINDKTFQVNTSRTQTISKADKISYWISKHYLAIFNLFLILYIGIPFLAPIFKKAGWHTPAEVIYKIYRPLCHQWAFRSFFLFGEQAYYPHAAAKIPAVLTFEQVSGITDLTDPSRLQARLFEGNALLGYKVALCERDVAIWGAMALFGLVYALTGRKLPKLHWMIWVLVGLGPIGLDGFSQLFSQIPSTFIQSILPYRESTPLLRALTGFVFGLTTAWFMFPLIEESMADTRRLLAKKFAVLKK